MCDYSIVFVVLVYRNYEDLMDFFKSFSVEDSHVIVVNSYHDEESEIIFREIADINGASFLSVPNNGYGAGNNRGIEYALSHFKFKYLVVSNADIIIDSFSLDAISKYDDAIIAPRIINMKGRNQNPSVPFVPFRWYERVRYLLFKRRHYHLIYLAFSYSRLTKICYYAIKSFRKKIFSAHGAFYVISKGALQALMPLYNEEMFLFNEEEHLGRKAQEREIATYYVPEIVVRHKEDGSMKIASINEFEMMRQSFLVYYDMWLRKK